MGDVEFGKVGGDYADLTVDGDDNSFTTSLTGVSAGTVTCSASVEVIIGGAPYMVTAANTVEITVTG